MRRAALISIVVLLAACASSGGRQQPIAEGHGAISMEIVPNPIIAHNAGGDAWEFPFEIVVRETGGRAVEIQRMTADVTAFGGLPVATDSYDAAQLRAMGFATSIAAHGELRYRMAPRRSIPDERLLAAVSANIRIDAVDDHATPVTTSTRVTMRR